MTAIMDILALLSINLVAVLVLFSGLWILAQINEDPSFVDAFWAFGIVLCALLSLVWGQADLEYRLLVSGLCLIWGGRLGFYLLLRWRQEGPDRRYSNLIASVRTKRGWSFGKTSALFIFLPQAFLLWITALPVQLGQASNPSFWSIMGTIGVVLAIIGLVMEAWADEQLRQFKADPGNANAVMDTGLWSWSRHPNYFGETVFWWGLFLIAAQNGIGALSIIGPVFVTFTLTRWSGVPLLEKTVKSHRPAYAQYADRTSAFIPWPPKKAAEPN